MKPSLQTRLGQQLTLTPQLRQAIKLLQLSAVELEAELALAVETNPLLEHTEELEREAAEDPAPDQTADNNPESAPAVSEDDHEFRDDARWEHTNSGVGHDRDGDYDATQFITLPEDLHDHLLWQLHLSHLSERDRRIGTALIEAITDDGYLGSSLEDIRATLQPESSVDDSELIAVLSTIQRFDPVGVGARDLAECLCVQLSVLDSDSPGLTIARIVARNHLEALARHGPERLAQQLAVSEASMTEA
ncbi:MAG: RNA polymerase factor sigma-54, partial [Gammaproteobacteria bacterium HGW-Gammaproteobacteria-7]